MCAGSGTGATTLAGKIAAPTTTTVRILRYIRLAGFPFNPHPRPSPSSSFLLPLSFCLSKVDQTTFINPFRAFIKYMNAFDYKEPQEATGYGVSGGYELGYDDDDEEEDDEEEEDEEDDDDEDDENDEAQRGGGAEAHEQRGARGRTPSLANLAWS